MNTHKFDLNIKNYKREELKDMFQLPSSYNPQMISSTELRLRNGILSNRLVDEETKLKTLYFLNEAKKILLENTEEQLKDFFNTSSPYLKPSLLETTEEHMVQTRQAKPYVRSAPSDYFEGVINPIDRKIVKQNLNIDTRFRENYYASSSSNFHVNLPLTINNIVSMSLVAIELPTTFFTISKQLGNNFFTMTINDEHGPITATIIVPDGNYTNDGIVDILNTLVQNISNSSPLLLLFKYILFGINLSTGNGSGQMYVGLDSSTPPLTITEISLDFQADRSGNEDKSTPLPLKLGWALGFRNGKYVNNTSFVSEGIVDLLGPKYLYLVVDDHNNNVNNSFFSAFNSSILNKNILARITLQRNTNGTQLFTQNNFNVVTTPRQYFGPVKIQTLNIQLLDEYGRILDLNNMDYSFCLSFQTIYDL